MGTGQTISRKFNIFPKSQILVFSNKTLHSSCHTDLILVDI